MKHTIPHSVAKKNVRGLLEESLTYVKPLYGITGELFVEEAPAVEEVAQAKPSVFDDIVVEPVYTRPNGEAYLPRALNIDGHEVHDVSLIRSAASKGISVLLYGPPGTGKTAMIEAAFPDAITVQGTIETETADFVGSWIQNTDGTYSWVDGPLVRAAEAGRKLLIDEIALIDPRSLAVVYGAMDGRDEIVVTQNPARGVVKVHPGFLVFGAFNPDVPGAILSDALISRFPMQISVETDWSVASRLGVPSKITQVARNLNKKYRGGELTGAPQLRELIAFSKLNDAYGEEFALRNFIGQLRPENRAAAAEAVKAVFGWTPEGLTI